MFYRDKYFNSLFGLSLFTVIFLIYLLALLAVLASGCKKAENISSSKVGLIVGSSGVDDKTFNQAVWEGLQKASHETDITIDFKTSETIDGYPAIIEQFVTDGYHMIIAPGFDKTQAIYDAAINDPECSFLFIDGKTEEIPDNLLCVKFDSDQASFMAGFIAAFWADFKDSYNPLAGYIGGPEFEDIIQIKTGFVDGIAYYNSFYGKDVDVAGYHLTNFTDTINAVVNAESLVANGADIMFAFAGYAGNYALRVAAANKIQVIGVDSDEYISFPEIGEWIITSSIKNLDKVTFDQVISFTKGEFNGGQVYRAGLIDDGVGLAPFHEYDNLIPDTIKSELESIRYGLINGTITTGWK